MLKLVIFDHDGLMVNSENVVFAAIEKIYKNYNKVFTWEYYCKYIGTPVIPALENYYKDIPLPISFKEFVEERNRLVNASLLVNLKLMPGLKDLITYLKQNKIILAISTSGKRDYIDSNLNKFKIKKYFKTITCVNDVKRGKPYPDLIEKTLEVTGITKEEAVLLEDSPNGIKAGIGAGVFTIAIPTKGVNLNLFSQANIITRNLLTTKKIFSFFINP